MIRGCLFPSTPLCACSGSANSDRLSPQHEDIRRHSTVLEENAATKIVTN
jgi:hypothetical protein